MRLPGASRAPKREKGDPSFLHCWSGARSSHIHHDWPHHSAANFSFLFSQRCHSSQCSTTGRELRLARFGCRTPQRRLMEAARGVSLSGMQQQFQMHHRKYTEGFGGGQREGVSHAVKEHFPSGLEAVDDETQEETCCNLVRSHMMSGRRARPATALCVSRPSTATDRCIY